MSDLVGNPEDQFSCIAALFVMKLQLTINGSIVIHVPPDFIDVVVHYLVLHSFNNICPAVRTKLQLLGLCGI